MFEDALGFSWILLDVFCDGSEHKPKPPTSILPDHQQSSVHSPSQPHFAFNIKAHIPDWSNQIAN
jgi:hypothetical protein